MVELRAGPASPSARETLGIEIEPAPIILIKDLKSIQRDIKSARVPLQRSVKRVMIPSIRRNFDVGGRPSWPPLAEFTLQRRSREGYGSRPLIKSGNLRRKATTQKIWTIRGPQGVAFVDKMPFEAWYGDIHQMGHGQGSGRKKGAPPTGMTPGAPLPAGGAAGMRGAPIPARPFLLIQDEDVPKIRQIFAEWIGERTSKHWSNK